MNQTSLRLGADRQGTRMPRLTIMVMRSPTGRESAWDTARCDKGRAERQRSAAGVLGANLGVARKRLTFRQDPLHPLQILFRIHCNGVEGRLRHMNREPVIQEP